MECIVRYADGRLALIRPPKTLIGNTMNTLNKRICATLTAISMTLGSTAFSAQSSAHNGDGLFALSTLSALPVASVQVTGAAVGSSAVAASVAVVALPVTLAGSGAVLVVKSVEVSARGAICVLERASDGASTTIEITGRMAERTMLRTGQAVQVSVVAAGAVLSVSGAAIAFVPSELGRALLHNERLTF